jgi:2,3-bisphosphoglycerate-independent phosphoglycerate mutase
MRPVVLAILDGWGYSPQNVGNAIMTARTPNMTSYMNNYPSVLLQASGKAVGLTWGETGNSEVGHLTIGAGRVVFQYLSRINKAIETGDFFKNPVFVQAVDHVKKNNSKIHFAGLLTSGSVHSYFNHILALIELAQKNNLQKVKLHLFTDGKDSGLREGKQLLLKLDTYLKEHPNIKLATVVGRDVSMDRNENWNLTEEAYLLLTEGKGEQADDAIKKIQESYDQGIFDGKIPPLVIDPDSKIEKGDALIFFNFREDSMRQLTRTFVDENIDKFERKQVEDLMVIGMTRYIEHPNLFVAFPPPEIKNGLSEFMSLNGKKQLHIAETEKYAHVTFFFNGLQNAPFEGETDIFIKSERKADQDPQMMANEILEKTLEELNKDFYDFIVINFANPDLVAHSGNLEKTIIGVEVVDSCIGKLREAVEAKNGILIITADHGNAESLASHGGEAETKHNLSPVPFHIVVKEYERQKSQEEIQEILSGPNGIIADIAPTIIEIMGIEKPAEMTGESLIKVVR